MKGGLRMILAANPSPMTLEGTRTYIVGEREVAIIDPGPLLVGHVDEIVAAVAGAERVEIVVTHRHADHSGAAAEVARRVGGRIRGREDAPSTGGGKGLTDRVTIPTDFGPLTVLETPGHSADHVALVWKAESDSAGPVVFVGDLLLGAGDTTLVAAPQGSVADYLRSLDRLRALDADLLYPAHGPPITDPATVIDRFRYHRLKRVEEVRLLLADNPGITTEALVQRMYGPLAPRIRLAAMGSVEAVRVYLGE